MNPFQNLILLKALIIVLFLAAMFDLRTCKIPCFITLPAVVGALTYYAGLHGFSGLFFSMAGLLTGFLLCLTPYLIGALGSGDVKLMAAVGAFLGAKAVVADFLYTTIIGGIYALSAILLHRDYFRGCFKNRQASLYKFFLTQRIPRGFQPIGADRFRLKFGLTISFGTGLYIVAKTKGLDFLW